jgi:hypothetical protein
MSMFYSLTHLKTITNEIWLMENGWNMSILYVFNHQSYKWLIYYSYLFHVDNKVIIYDYGH